jgi:FkbM family methyltransferase
MLYTLDEYKDRCLSAPNLLYDGNINRLVETKFGYFLYNRYDKYVGRAMGYYGEYSIEEVWVMSMLCREGDVAMDVGANMGALTLPMSRIVGDSGYVYAFEPQRLVFQVLCSNMAINSITNVECLNFAVGEDNGVREIPEKRVDSQNNLGSFSLKDDLDFSEKTHNIMEITIDHYFRDLEQLDFIKMDIEGMEISALKGAEKTIEKFRPAMYIENDRSDSSRWLIDAVKDFGYKMYWHKVPMFNPDNFRGNKKNIYGKTISINMICLPEEADIEFDPEMFKVVE